MAMTRIIPSISFLALVVSEQYSKCGANSMARYVIPLPRFTMQSEV